MAAAGGPIRLIRSPSQTGKAVLLEGLQGNSQNPLHSFRIGAFQDGLLADALPILFSAVKLLLARQRRFKLIIIVTAKPGLKASHHLQKEISELQHVIELVTPGDTHIGFREFDLCLWTGTSTERPLCIVKGMAEGVPWIAIGSKGAVELLFGKDGDAHGPAGLVVPPDAADMIADYCEWFMDHPQIRQQFAESGRRRAKELDGI